MKRSRVPGPIQNTAPIGNSGDRVGPFTSPWISLDPTSSGWTFNDPDSTGTVKSLNVGNTGMRFVLDRFAATNLHRSERWNASLQHGGRYYKKLQGDRGPLMWTDTFSIEFLLWRTAVDANSGAGNQDDSGIAIGIADSSCIAGTSSVKWIGIGSYSKKGSGNQNITGQLGGDTGTTNTSDIADQRRFYVSIGPGLDDNDGDGHPKVHRAMCYALDDNNDLRQSTTCASQTHEFTGTDPVYMFVCPTFLSNSGAPNDADFTYKVWYRISEDPERMLPQYTPNQG